MQTHLDEASLVLDRSGYALVTMTPHPDGHAAPLWDTLEPDVILSLTPVSDEQFAMIEATGAVALIPGRGTATISQGLRIGEGPQVQIEHLLQRGRSAIAFAGPADPRVRGLADERLALADRVLTERTGTGVVARALISETDAAATVQAWVHDGVDAVVAYNDDVAALVLSAALRHGIRVPEKLAVIGHDDTPLSRAIVPALSTVRVDAGGLGRYLAALALSAARGTDLPDAGPSAEVLLIPRETT
jgi:DNA-binding LacI/PurR family transcriptional regulator